jgi:hypothetical protein
VGNAAFAIYIALALFVNPDNECWPSQSTLTEITNGKSISNVRKHLYVLRDAGFISWRDEVRPGKKTKRRIYTLCGVVGMGRDPMGSKSDPDNASKMSGNTGSKMIGGMDQKPSTNKKQQQQEKINQESDRSRSENAPLSSNTLVDAWSAYSQQKQQLPPPSGIDMLYQIKQMQLLQQLLQRIGIGKRESQQAVKQYSPADIEHVVQTCMQRTPTTNVAGYVRSVLETELGPLQLPPKQAKQFNPLRDIGSGAGSTRDEYSKPITKNERTWRTFPKSK